jgi:periplasmic protein TonB
MNRTGEAVVVADSVLVKDDTIKEITQVKPNKPPRNKPKPAKPARDNASIPKSVPKTNNPGGEPAVKPDPVKPAPEDPNKPIHLISAARKPVFKKCDSSNKEKEEKCTNEKIFRFLKSRLQYPEKALQNSVEGVVVVSFVVERDGSITDVKALNDIGGDCAKEAVRLIKQLPKFKPGLNANGNPIRVQYTQSIRFSLK